MNEPTALEETDLPRTLGPYLLVEVVGRGGMGLVYRALDSRGENVAVKVIRRDLTEEPEVRRRFAREARAVAQLVHPNIARLLDYGLDDGETYMVMEYVAGGSMVPWRTAPPDGETLRRVFLGILRALAHAHARGIVHRDLKPENVLLHVDRAGQLIPKVLDFGVAHFRNELPTDGSQHQFVGTPEYMSPEQVLNADDVSPATDLYAVGVMLFETVTGKLPFSRGSTEATIVAHVNAPIPPVEARAGYRVDGIEALVTRLLAKQPSGRFLFAADVRQALEKCRIDGEPVHAGRPVVARGQADLRGDISTMQTRRTASGEVFSVPDPPALGLVGLRDPPFIGRENELRRIASIAAEALSQRAGRAVLVAGEAGTGKTRLLSQLSETIEETGTMQVWSGTVQRGGTPDGALRMAFRRGMRLTGLSTAQCELRIGETLARQNVRDPWEEAALLQYLGPEDGPPRLVQQESARWALLERVLRRACAERPVLLRLEDVHLDDGETLRFVNWMLDSRGSRLPWMIVLTARPMQAALGIGSAMTRAWQELQSHLRQRGATVELKPLPVPVIERMLGEQLAVMDKLAHAIALRSAGNVQLAVELVRFCLQGGVLENPDMDQKIDAWLPAAMEPVLRSRLADAERSGEYDESTLTIWQLLAQAGDHVPISLVMELVREAGIATGPSAVDRALTAGLLTGVLREPHRNTFSFDNALIHEALLAQVQRLPNHAEFQAAVVRAMVAHRAVAGTPDAATLAQQLERGGEWQAALGWYLKSAGEALERSAHDAAVRSYARVLDLCKAHESEGGRQQPAYGDALIGFAETAFLVGDLDDAAAMARAIRSVRPEAEAIATRLQGQIAFRRGDMRTARELLHRAVDGFRASGPLPLLAATKLELARLENAEGRTQEAEMLLRKARENFARLGDRRGEASVVHAMGQVASRMGMLEEAERYTQNALETLESLHDRAAAAHCRHTLAEIALWQGDARAAMEQFSRAREELGTIGERHAQLGATLGLGRAYEALRDPRAARALYSEALDGFRGVGDRGGETMCLLATASLDAYDGQFARALPVLRDVMERDQAERIDHTDFVVMLMEAARRCIQGRHIEMGRALLKTASYKLGRIGSETFLSDQVDQVEYLLQELDEQTSSAMISLVNEMMTPVAGGRDDDEP